MVMQKKQDGMTRTEAVDSIMEIRVNRYVITGIKNQTENGIGLTERE